jgi:hypothetical protein
VLGGWPLTSKRRDATPTLSLAVAATTIRLPGSA